jgi:peptidoglycan/LPS O-acetylase OafA/YrhL
MAPSDTHPTERLDALSGLRSFAISHVVCYHLGAASFEEAPVLVDRIRRNANVLMPLFFVLSGFVLTYRYLEPIRSGQLGARAFWVSRFLRLWPIYVVALALRFGVDAFVNRGVPMDNVAGTISQALMLQGFTPPLVWYGNAPGWTVSVEAFFYLLFPWLVVRFSRLSWRAAITLVTVLWLLGQLLALAYAIKLPDGWPPARNPRPLFLDLLRFLPPLHLPSFLAGMLTARVFMEDRARGHDRPGGLLVLLSFLPIAFVTGGGLGRHGLGWLPWQLPLTHNGLLAPAWSLLVLGLAHGGAPARWLSARPLVRLGDASYGLYILHFPVYDAVATFVVEDWDRKPLFLLQVFALLLPLSVLSFERFEQPLRRALLHQWLAARGERIASRSV